MEITEKKDIVLRCATCGSEFIWTAGEKAYYQERSLQPPRHCYHCRLIRRGLIKSRRGENG